MARRAGNQDLKRWAGGVLLMALALFFAADGAWVVRAATLERHNQRILRAQIESETRRAQELSASVAQEVQRQGELENQLQDVRNRAGLTAVQGTGVVVTLDDAPREALIPGNPVAFGLVHDLDVLHVINALRIGGAEAISVNGTRVLGGTRIRCGGPTINVASNRLTPPFEIRAIGETGRLREAVEGAGLLSTISVVGVRAVIEEREHLVVPAVNRYRILRYAQPASEGG